VGLCPVEAAEHRHPVLRQRLADVVEVVVNQIPGLDPSHPVVLDRLVVEDLRLGRT
jgi:hypothetical protein